MTDPTASSFVPELVGALTEPITKLIETISSGIGTAYEPTRIRRKAEGEARAAKVKAISDVEVARIRAEGERELAEWANRANQRLAAKELRRQKNIESIAVKAVHQLPPSVSREPVDEDWTVQFFNYAQDIGNEEMQLIWAGILAGEVNQPGAFSLRTMQALRMLRPSDARLFRQLCPYVWQLSDNSGAYLGGTKADEYLESKHFDFDSFLQLDSLGLILVRGNISIALDPEGPKVIQYYGRRFTLKTKRPNFFRAYPLTDIGAELGGLSKAEPDWAYCDVVLTAWHEAGIEVELMEAPR